MKDEIKNINKREAAARMIMENARLILEECHRQKKELSGDFHPRTARKGSFTELDALNMEAKIRTRLLGKN